MEYVKYKSLAHRGRPIEDEIAAVKELDRRHEENYNQMLAIDTTMANLKLNEAESDWKANFTQAIRDDLNASVSNGDYSKAGDAIKRASRKFATDQGLIGRLNYQSKYEADKKRIMEDPNIDADTKAYWLDKNKYAYKDIVDENGNVVGGNSFSADPLAKDFDFNNLFINAIRTTAPTKTNINGVKRETKTAEDILRTSLAFIENNPEAKARINQDYAIQIAKANKGEASDVVDKNGIVISKEEYIRNRALSTAKEAAYSDIDTSVREQRQIEQERLNQQARLKELELKLKGNKDATPTKKSSGSGDKEPDDKAVLTSKVTAGKELVKVNTFSGAKETRDKAVSDLSKLANTYGVKLDPASKDYTAIANEISKSIASRSDISPETQYKLLNDVNNARLDAYNNDQIMEALSKNITASKQPALLTAEALDKGDLSLITDSSHKGIITKAMNAIFSNSKDSGEITNNNGVASFSFRGKADKATLDDITGKFGAENVIVQESKNGNTILKIKQSAAIGNASALTKLYTDNKYDKLYSVVIEEDVNGSGNVAVKPNPNATFIRNSFKEIDKQVVTAYKAMEESSTEDSAEEVDKYVQANVGAYTVPPNAVIGDFKGEDLDNNLREIIRTISINEVPIKVRSDAGEAKGTFTDLTDETEKEKVLNSLLANVTDKDKVGIKYTSTKNKFVVTIAEPEYKDIIDEEDATKVKRVKTGNTTKYTLLLDLNGNIQANHAAIESLYNSEAFRLNTLFDNARNAGTSNITTELRDRVTGVSTVDIKRKNGNWSIGDVIVSEEEAKDYVSYTGRFNEAQYKLASIDNPDLAGRYIEEVSNGLVKHLKDSPIKRAKRDAYANSLLTIYNTGVKAREVVNQTK